jgi:hypothetical protein
MKFFLQHLNRQKITSLTIGFKIKQLNLQTF